MTTRRKFNVFLFILLLGVFSPLMAQSMSDSQVLEYVKDGIRQGKEQKQLASELARRGVTKEQATRVKQLYEQQNNVNASNATGTDINESRLREEMKENTSDMLEDHPSTQDLARGNQVFGRNIFNTRNLTFEPSVNIATPLNYRLGPSLNYRDFLSKYIIDLSCVYLYFSRYVGLCFYISEIGRASCRERV